MQPYSTSSHRGEFMTIVLRPNRSLKRNEIVGIFDLTSVAAALRLMPHVPAQWKGVEV